MQYGKPIQRMGIFKSELLNITSVISISKKIYFWKIIIGNLANAAPTKKNGARRNKKVLSKLKNWTRQITWPGSFRPITNAYDHVNNVSSIKIIRKLRRFLVIKIYDNKTKYMTISYRIDHSEPFTAMGKIVDSKTPGSESCQGINIGIRFVNTYWYVLIFLKYSRKL